MFSGTREEFIHPDADEILKIPLGRTQQDRSAWAYEKSGVFSVRSAYRMLSEKVSWPRTSSKGASTVAGDQEPIWRKVWKLNMPPKVRVFCWRLIHGFIPAGAVLHRQHIETMSICDCCGAREESILHALTGCTYVRLFWEALRKFSGHK